MSRRWILLFLLLASGALHGRALATSYPLTITDDLGREVTLTHAPERIVSMIPSSTETVCALDACDRLVGVDEASDYPARVRELPRLGNAYQPNLEGLVQLRPDLVLVDQFSALADKLEALGVPVYAGTPQGYDAIFDTFALFGRLLDEEAAASRLTGRVRAAVGAVERATAGTDAPSVYVEIDNGLYSAGPTSFLGQLIARAGGDNIVPARLGDYPQLEPEFVLAQDPDLILLADAPAGTTPASVAARPGWATLTAVTTGRVIALSQTQVDELSRPGPRVADAVALLARLLHPGIPGN